jgi:hypothetical protein
MKIILSLLLTIGILSCALSQRVIYTINKNDSLSRYNEFLEKECSCFFSSEILIDRVVWIKKVFPPDNIVILQEKPVTKSVSKPKVEVSKPRVVVEEVPVDTLKRKITWYTSYPDGTKRIDSTRTEKLAIIK